MTDPDPFPYRASLQSPVVGIEAEFALMIDGEEVEPETLWRHPSDFIDVPLLRRTSRSSQLPTGGAVYFDKGVIEVVTPVIEIGPRSAARVVRSLWEQIEFVFDHLLKWGERNGHHVALKAFSAHYNVSYELRRDERTAHRTIQKLALLLAHILPVPVLVTGANRRSTGIGVRPRRDRIEITLDFTPDPGLMIATTALILGIVRDVTSWPSYMLRLLDRLPIALPAGVQPGRHTTRKGWLTRDFHFPANPFETSIDEPIWKTTGGETMSLRQMALVTSWFFRRSIRELSDPFSFKLLFAVLEGRRPSLLDLPERPSAYDDVGRSIRWGMALREFEHWTPGERISTGEDLARHFAVRQQARLQGEPEEKEKKPEEESEAAFIEAELQSRSAGEEELLDSASQALTRRSSDGPGGAAPPWTATDTDRRRSGSGRTGERRERDRRKQKTGGGYPSERLERSPYEEVFRRVASGDPMTIEGQILRPVAMKGWYHAVFLDEKGEERLISLDQLLAAREGLQPATPALSD